MDFTLLEHKTDSSIESECPITAAPKSTKWPALIIIFIFQTKNPKNIEKTGLRPICCNVKINSYNYSYTVMRNFWNCKKNSIDKKLNASHESNKKKFRIWSQFKILESGSNQNTWIPIKPPKKSGSGAHQNTRIRIKPKYLNSRICNSGNYLPLAGFS